MRIYAAIIIWLFSATPALAAAPTLTVSPAKYDLKVLAGQIQTANFKITNKSDIALPIHVEVMDFAPKDKKGGVDYGISLPGRSAKDWFFVQRRDMALAPGEERTVEATISPPESTPDGSYFAVVMFQASLPDKPDRQSDASSATIVPWIGTLVLLQVGDLPTLDANSLTITKVSYPKISQKSTIPFSVEVKNNTNFAITPQTEFQLKNWLSGRSSATAKTDENTILPGSSRQFDGTISNSSPLGVYRGVASVLVAGYRQDLVSGWLSILTWIGTIIIGVIVIGHILAIKHRHRIIAHVHRIAGRRRQNS